MDFNPYELLTANGFPHTGSIASIIPGGEKIPSLHNISLELSSAAHELIREHYAFHDSNEYFEKKVANLVRIRDVVAASVKSGNYDHEEAIANLVSLKSAMAQDPSPAIHSSQFLIARLIDGLNRNANHDARADNIRRHTDAIIALRTERQSQFAINANKTFKAGLADLIENDFDLKAMIQESSALVASLGCIATGTLAGLHALSFTTANIDDIKLAIVLTASSMAVHALGGPIATVVERLRHVSDKTQSENLDDTPRSLSGKNSFSPK